MKGMAYSANGVPIEVEFYENNVSTAPPQVAECADTYENTSSESCCYGKDDTPISHAFLFRIVGLSCIIFGTIEAGLGGSIYPYFKNIRAGSWWAAILVFTSGIIINYTKSITNIIIINDNLLIL